MSAQKVAVFLISCVLAFPFGAYAQSSTASVNGTVRDATGSVIPDTLVVSRNIDTNVEMRANSNAVGNYAFLNVPVGRYTIEASKTGFSINRLEAFTLTVNQTATFNLTLSVGSTQQSVTVEAIGDQVESSTAELGAVIGTKPVQELPLNGRNFTQLLTLTPGMSPSNPTSGSDGYGSNPVGSYILPVVNGQTGRSSFFMMDGINDYGDGRRKLMRSRRLSMRSRNSRFSRITMRLSSVEFRVGSSMWSPSRGRTSFTAVVGSSCATTCSMPVTTSRQTSRPIGGISLALQAAAQSCCPDSTTEGTRHSSFWRTKVIDCGSQRTPISGCRPRPT